MSILIGYDTENYIFRREGQEYRINQQLYYYLFYTHGYPLDPWDKRGARLTDISLLYEIAQTENNQPLLTLLEREIHLSLIVPAIPADQEQQVMEELLHLGLYLGGWNGPSEPYPSQLGQPHDIVSTEMRAEEILAEQENFNQLKDYQVVSYSLSLSKQRLQPHVLSLTIGDLLQQLPQGVTQEIARQLVHTCYYYLNDIYGGSYDLLHSLIYTSAQ